MAGNNGDIPPACAKCGALERHRVFRSIFEQLRGETFKTLSALMFSKDPSIAADWFASLRHSIYGTSTSLDVQKIDLPDSAVDVVICNHILEHVPDYEAAFREIVRVISDRGFAFVSFPHPHSRPNTWDWGYPKPEQHGHYRIFGADIEQKIPKIVPTTGVLRVVGTDPVTEGEDRAYVLSRNRTLLREFSRKSTSCAQIN